MTKHNNWLIASLKIDQAKKYYEYLLSLEHMSTPLPALDEIEIEGNTYLSFEPAGYMSINASICCQYDTDPEYNGEIEKCCKEFFDIYLAIYDKREELSKDNDPVEVDLFLFWHVLQYEDKLKRT